MDAVAEQRVLLGLDVVGSAGNPGDQLHRVSEAWQQILRDALDDTGISRDDILEWEEQGDGANLTLPHALLGLVVDLCHHVHSRATAHNRRYRPDIRLRLAIETGPVPDRPTFLRAKIDRARLLDASEFKNLLARCHRESEDGAQTGLIMSASAFQTAFGGDYTAIVRRSEFAPLSVSAKEFRATAWVRVPGFDARSLRALSSDPSEAGQRPDNGDALKRPSPTREALINNSATTVSGVQAGIVHGGITQRHEPS
jgi:hypothetical protein